MSHEVGVGFLFVPLECQLHASPPLDHTQMCTPQNQRSFPPSLLLKASITSYPE
jgi:hypothetical protein